MKYRMNSEPNWDEYYHEDNAYSDYRWRYIRQTRDGEWWYCILTPHEHLTTPWTPIPEASSLEEAAAVADLVWRIG